MKKFFKKLKKLTFVALPILLIVGGYASLFFLPLNKEQAYKNEEIIGYRVVIDAGHGGIYGGAIGSSKVSESSINLQISYELKSIFEKQGHFVTMTRKDENGLYDNTSKGFKLRDLKKRVEIAKSVNFDIFISIHLNKYISPKRRGAQVFFKKGNERGRLLAESIQTELNLLNQSIRMYDALSGDYYLLNCLEGGAVIVECGFLSNPEEENLLLTKSYKKSLATAIYKGAIRYAINTEKYL